MEPELAIEASREAIKLCFVVGGPILAVCLIVGLVMGLAQSMSHIQDQALATVPKILAILAVVGFALPWFADRMVEFSKDQFSRSFMSDSVSATALKTEPASSVESLLVAPALPQDSGYYPQLGTPRIKSAPVFKKAAFEKPQSEVTKEPTESKNPFSLPSYRFSRRHGENIEG